METSDGERREAALNAIASVASLWPAGIYPLTNTLREYIDADDDDDVRAAALAALVYVGRENPDALEPLSTKLGTDRYDSELLTTTRRGYEGISILLADGGHSGVGVFDTLLQGLRHTDSSVTEYSLEGLIALDDPRALYPLKRIRDGVPDWSTLPPAFRSEPSETEQRFQEMISTTAEPELTAADAIAALDESESE